MGQAKRYRDAIVGANLRESLLPQDAIARAVRDGVVARAAGLGLAGGLCGFHAAVGRVVLLERFGIASRLSAGDFQRRVTPQVVHSYAGRGGRIDAASGACHVWLTLAGSGATVDFDAWEEPVRYDATDRPHGPWTAPRPDYYWVGPGDRAPGLEAVRPDRDAAAVVEARLSRPAERRFIAAACTDALHRLGSRAA